MSSSLSGTTRLALSALHRLQWEESQQNYVILYPEGMVELNRPAAEILKLCDGTRPLDLIVDELERAFETTGLRDDICELIESALENGWLRIVS